MVHTVPVSLPDQHYMRKGIKVVINPSQNYFDQLQELISETERWNYRSTEYKLWLTSYDKFWMYMAIDEDNDKVISSVSLALQHDSEGLPFYSIGNYYCVSNWRGKGISNKLFEMAMKVAGNNNITLYGVVLMSDLYAKRHNFSIMNEFWHYFAEVASCNLVVPASPNGFYCKKIDEHDWDKLHSYDEMICDLNRRKYIRATLSLPDTVARLVFNDSGKVVGFGSIKFVTGNEMILAPLYAESFDAATALIAALLKSIPRMGTYSSLVTIYPDANNDVPRLLSLISNNNFSSHKKYRNQYTKEMMEFPQHKIYAIEECSHNPV